MSAKNKVNASDSKRGREALLEGERPPMGAVFFDTVGVRGVLAAHESEVALRIEKVCRASGYTIRKFWRTDSVDVLDGTVQQLTHIETDLGHFRLRDTQGMCVVGLEASWPRWKREPTPWKVLLWLRRVGKKMNWVEKPAYVRIDRAMDMAYSLLATSKLVQFPGWKHGTIYASGVMWRSRGRLFRMYDKAVESGWPGPRWRVELQVRGAKMIEKEMQLSRTEGATWAKISDMAARPGTVCLSRKELLEYFLQKYPDEALSVIGRGRYAAVLRRMVESNVRRGMAAQSS
ncbi:MAG: hypothetical protein E6R05_03260 [Candidatus Moraniibacteriota bacterium]|nr:MAG: hypothetical protein E6R05_03260 [Candidatus Moranbacteria bacterium]